MPRVHATVLLLFGLTLLAGCGDNDEPPTAPTPPTEIETTLEGTLTVNGGQTYVFLVERVGQITARIIELEPSENVAIGLSLGTWSPNACQILLANDNAQLNTVLVGNATTVGNFCVRVHDVGTLTGPVDFTIRLTHF
jgi:hypothetical protein